MRVTALVLGLVAVPAAGQEPYRVGVTLPPYFSWVAAVAKGAPVEVVPVLGPDADVHNVRPTPAILKRLAGIDAVVVNGLGHDAFIDDLLRAAGNAEAERIEPNRGVPLIPYGPGEGHAHGREKEKPGPAPERPAYNPHTFLSITSAVQQVYAIERALSKLLPDHAETFRSNARAYARRLRKLKAEASARLAGAAVTRVATVHDGYSYLLQEFGIGIAGVIEPAHGIRPSAKELAETIGAIRKAGVTVVFSEPAFPARLLRTIEAETGVRVFTLDHMDRGASTPERFEESMRKNLETLVRALAP